MNTGQLRFTENQPEADQPLAGMTDTAISVQGFTSSAIKSKENFAML